MGLSMGAVGLMGGGLAAMGQLQQGKQARAAGKFNARALLMQARTERERGEFQAGRIREQASAIQGQQKATLAAQGVDVGQGTALALQEETARLAEEDVAQARHNAALAAWGLRVQASQSRLEGQQQYRAGVTRAAGTLLGASRDSGLFG